MIRPDVGSISDRERHTVDGAHTADLAREQAARDREVLDQILDHQQCVVRRRACLSFHIAHAPATSSAL
jgi:hypothetical protein